METPWGTATDDILFGRIGDVAFRCLPRHRRGRRILPGEASARATIDTLERSG